MNHLTEEELVLHYYGEEGDALTADRHLEECPHCRETFASLQRVLNVVDSLPVPERGPEYGAEVWRRVSPSIPARRKWLGALLPSFEARPMAPWRWAAAAAAMACLLVAAFYAGRFYQPGSPVKQPTMIATKTAPAGDPQVKERVLLVAVGDYLERSQMVLIELANADPKGKLDISDEQERAAGLVSESRLYRQTAEHTGDATVAGTLDEIDRVLLDIAHGPSELSSVELDGLRKRLKSEGILFKIRVLGSKVRTPEGKNASSADPGKRAL
ncbi:MAG TPA: hypothetical protein VHW24_08970 [Bryobacteraceae bacterium]|nr:hypothetical protein [Bryobacteraceae bacterium]